MTFNAFNTFTLVPVIIFAVFILVFGIIIFRLIQSGREWNKNNHSPVLTVYAKVVAKRMSVRTYHNHGQNMHSTTASTDYFATFEVESGSRMELKVPDKEYGMLAEDDTGRLTFQGTRYKGFERDV